MTNHDDNNPDFGKRDAIGKGFSGKRHQVELQSPQASLEPEAVPGPGKYSKRAKHPFVRFMNGLFTILFIVLVGLGGLLYIGCQQFKAPGPLNQDKSVIISRGMNSETIATTLEMQGLISNKYVFLAGLQLTDSRGELKAGEYLIEANASMLDIMTKLVEGKSVLHSITFPEGWSSAQIVAKLNADPILTGEVSDIPAEGTLLPETYKFSRGDTVEQVLRRMQQAHDRAVEEIWARRVDNLPIETPQEMVILASIVEKETGRADERTRVAGVFINRLNKNMRLQSDPTILYGLYKGDAWNEYRSILRSELDAPNNAYNTYQINGLPPGPIANPGRASMEAVVNPSRTNDLFFVADGTGGHVFAETLEEHNRNVARWRRIEQERRESEAAAQ
jgi:UPF0755 protein